MSQKTSDFRNFLSFFKKAIVNPERSPIDDRMLARLLLKPVIFDLYALFVQLRDRRRLMSLPKPDPDDQSDAAIAVRHNLQEIQDKYITTSRRVEKAYQIATIPWRSLKDETVLIVGCRNVMELHQARLAGFSWKNIHGLDLFSTNEKILTMNMEDMKDIENDAYDLVTMINTLVYSSKPKKVLSEVVRILKPGGRFVFTYGRVMEDSDAVSPYSGEVLITGTYPASDLVSHLQKIGAQLYYHDVTDEKNALNQLQASHWLGFVKSEPSVDPI